jgi:hypothetical protein
MDDSTRIIIILVLIILLLIAVAILGSNFMMRNALKAVIKMFRNGQALTPETAKFSADLGFKGRQFLQMRALRDYKPTALQFLMNNNIIKATEDGRVYLSEEVLAMTSLGQKKK